MAILDFIIQDYKDGKVKITERKQIATSNKGKKFTKTFHYLEYENGDIRHISKNDKKELEEKALS